MPRKKTPQDDGAQKPELERFLKYHMRYVWFPIPRHYTASPKPLVTNLSIKQKHDLLFLFTWCYYKTRKSWTPSPGEFCPRDLVTEIQWFTQLVAGVCGLQNSKRYLSIPSLCWYRVLLSSLGWPGTQRPTCFWLCLLNAGIKEVCATVLFSDFLMLRPLRQLVPHVAVTPVTKLFCCCLVIVSFLLWLLM